MRSPAMVLPTPLDRAPGDLAADHQWSDAHTPRVGGNPLSPAIVEASSGNDPRGVLDRGHAKPGSQVNGASVNSSNGGSAQVVGDTQNWPGGTADHRDVGGDHARADAQMEGVPASDPSDALLLICADALDDLERVWIANENRLRSLRQVKGLDGSAAEAKLAALTHGLEALKHQATLDLKRAMRAHPLGPWVKASIGVGEKQGARLIAAIGDPAWNYAEDRPRRGPAELWAYCGYSPSQKRTKGVKSNWNAQAKMRAYLCAEAAVKAGVRKLDGCDDTGGYDAAGREAVSPLGQVYLDARASWADRDTSDGHRHNHALRRVAKEILKELWREARRLSGTSVNQGASEPPPADDRGVAVA